MLVEILPKKQQLQQPKLLSLQIFISITILTGHTDSKGENEFNKGLGERRVESTKQYLKSKGVAADRITVVSLGEEKPVKSNDSDKGRAMNRRVEVSLK